MGFWDEVKRQAANAKELSSQGLQRVIALGGEQYQSLIKKEATANVANAAFNTLDYSCQTSSAVPWTYREMALDPQTQNIVKAQLRIFAFDVSLLALTSALNQYVQDRGEEQIDSNAGWLSTDTLLILGLSCLGLAYTLFEIRQYHLSYAPHTTALSIQASRILPKSNKNAIKSQDYSRGTALASLIRNNIDHVVTLGGIGAIESFLPYIGEPLSWLLRRLLYGSYPLIANLPKLSYQDQRRYFNAHAELRLALGLTHWLWYGPTSG